MPSLQSLLKRDFGCEHDVFGNQVNCTNSRWNSTGRWILLACVIAGFILLFALCACITARKRRRGGTSPYYGTAWLAPKPGAYNHQQYGQQPYGQQQYGQQQYGAQGPDQGGYYTTPTPAPPYSPNQHFTPPPGPPPMNGREQAYEMQPPRTFTPGTPPGSPPPQSNNPYFPPSNPPPAHTHNPFPGYKS